MMGGVISKLWLFGSTTSKLVMYFEAIEMNLQLMYVDILHHVLLMSNHAGERFSRVL